jgi:hypothetical protein
MAEPRTQNAWRACRILLVFEMCPRRQVGVQDFVASVTSQD